MEDSSRSQLDDDRSCRNNKNKKHNLPASWLSLSQTAANRIPAVCSKERHSPVQSKMKRHTQADLPVRHSAVVILLATLSTLPTTAALNVAQRFPSTRPFASRSSVAATTTAVASHTYYTVVDGPCWDALRESPLVDPQAQTAPVGCLPVVTGNLASSQEAVIGLLATAQDSDDDDDDSRLTLTTGEVLWKESVAHLGTASPSEAAATYTTALTHLYPLAVADAQSVGGSETSFSGVMVPSQSVVILGGHADAVWAAQALATLGTAQVNLVSPQKLSISGFSSISVLSANDEDGFAERVGKFEALLDTVGYESASGSVVRLLESRHECATYLSTRSRAEEILASEGLLWGPGKAKDYQKSIKAPSHTATVPVAGWGNLVQQLFDANVHAPTASLQTIDSSTSSDRTTWVRGWSLKSTWEANSWPSSTDGRTRYGLPTLEDVEEEDDDDFMFTTGKADQTSVVDYESSPQTAGSSRASAIPTLTASPHILAVYGPEGLEEDVRKEELDCILFLSAPFCRTCRKLQGPYSRLARLNAEDEESEVVFAKAEIVGTFGKALGKELEVDSVPSFVLFRQGERFGKALSISKLPNSQLDLALQFLKDSQEWDDSQFDTGTTIKRPGTKI
jgi:hypothetical protein